jgi:hypothetical protein
VAWQNLRCFKWIKPSWIASSFLYVIYASPTYFSYKVPYKSISTNRHTDTNETFRTERSEGEGAVQWAGSGDVVRQIERSLMGGALGEDRGVGDVKLQAGILLEDMLELS